MKWFRLYHGAPSDPKFGRIARKTGQTRERAFFAWVMLLESASEADERGTIETDADAIADTLNCPTEDIEAILDQMRALGMIDGDQIAKWSERQPIRDDSAGRMRAKRQRDAQCANSDAPVTRQPTQVTRLDTDTDTDTDISSTSLRSVDGADAPPPSPEIAESPNSDPDPIQPVDWRAKLFTEAVAVLAGKPWPNKPDKFVTEAEARSLAGRLMKSRSNSAWQAWQAFLGARTAVDQVQYVLGALKPDNRNGARDPPARRDWTEFNEPMERKWQ